MEANQKKYKANVRVAVLTDDVISQAPYKCMGQVMGTHAIVEHLCLPNTCGSVD